MSRSLGDFNGKSIGLSAVPEIEIIELRDIDKFVVLGSDGVFDVMKCSEVISYVIRCEDKSNAAKYLVKEARSRWQDLNLCKKTKKKIADLPSAKSGIDDITAIVFFFDFVDG
jgi:serine/threonine protein phosphatase PrpC